MSWTQGNGYYSINGISIAGTMTQNVTGKNLIKITDIFGRESKGLKNQLYFISTMMEHREKIYLKINLFYSKINFFLLNINSLYLK